MPPHIKIVGAGVSGLTTALQLARSGKYEVTILAEHMPAFFNDGTLIISGDYHINYASPWAGANCLPVSKKGTDNHKYEKATWPELYRLATTLPEAGIHLQNAVEYRRDKDLGTPVGEWIAELVKPDPWFKDVMPNFRQLKVNEVPAGYDGGTSFTSVCINTALYLPWLASQCLRHGVNIRRAIFKNILDAAEADSYGGPADLIINCTGLSSLFLGGVEDKSMYPGRGQIVIVSNDPKVMAGTSGTDDGPDELTYIMHRAAGGGTVLGGCFQAGQWESQPDPNLAIRIMKRAVEVCPELVPSGGGIEALQVIRHAVGLRPMRKDGIRVGTEKLKGKDGRNVIVVHNYGHGGYGYQTSWGCAQEVERHVDIALKPRSKL